jgi:hypothetical protein
MIQNDAELAQNSSEFNALIAPDHAYRLAAGFTQETCWAGICLYNRPGACSPFKSEEINTYLKRIGD